MILRRAEQNGGNLREAFLPFAMFVTVYFRSFFIELFSVFFRSSYCYKYFERRKRGFLFVSI
jgi:hypothetical protein